MMSDRTHEKASSMQKLVILHLPAWSLILGDKPYGQPKYRADQPVFVVSKGLHLPVACGRSGLASVLGKAYALHGLMAGTCINLMSHISMMTASLTSASCHVDEKEHPSACNATD